MEQNKPTNVPLISHLLNSKYLQGTFEIESTNYFGHQNIDHENMVDNQISKIHSLMRTASKGSNRGLISKKRTLTTHQNLINAP